VAAARIFWLLRLDGVELGIGELEGEIVLEPFGVAFDLLVEAAGRVSEQARDIGIEDHRVVADMINGRRRPLAARVRHELCRFRR
jgi:hypothetical protein